MTDAWADSPVRPIGRVRTPFTQRFGIPRQGGLLDAIPGALELDPPHDRPEAWQGIEAFSHLWLVTWFHAGKGGGGLTVRPPRLGGNRRLGVFATRAPYRPNPVGLSLVRLAQADRSGPRVALEVRGADLLDGTPLLDVKPYVPYCDACPEAVGGFAGSAPESTLSVRWLAGVRVEAEAMECRYPGLVALIEAVLAADPRPAYQRDTRRHYVVRLYDLDVHWVAERGGAEVVGLRPAGGGG